MPKNNQKSTPKPGIVYVLTNQATHKYVKIGETINLRERLNVLDCAVPHPHEVYCAVEVADAKEAKALERLLHKIFANKRVPSKREFFEVEPERVASLLELTLFNGKWWTGGKYNPTVVKAREKRARRRAENFRFGALGIPKRAVLTFWRKPKLTATVVDDKNKVTFKGKRTTLSDAATKVLGTKYGVNGACWWEYQGKILNDIRTRKKQEAKTKTRMTRK